MIIATDDFKMFSINNLSNEVQHFSSAQVVQHKDKMFVSFNTEEEKISCRVFMLTLTKP